MAVAADVNYEELARSTDEFNGAQLKAVCVEAGMIALREGATKLTHEHFLSGIAEGESRPARVLFLPCPRCALLTRPLPPSSAEQEEEPAQLLHVASSDWWCSACGVRRRNVLFSSFRAIVRTSPGFSLEAVAGSACAPRVGG